MAFATGAEFLKSPLKGSFDFLLIDYKMEDLSGVDVLNALRGEGVDTLLGVALSAATGIEPPASGACEAA